VSLAKSDDISKTIKNPSLREKDGVCYSLPGDDFIVETRASKNVTDYWDQYKVLPPWYLYGNEDGVFRMLPGSPQECSSGESTYDPRIRPWYVAASSGPKDVILILDTSGSMRSRGRLDLMKEAAKRVIGTLGVSDYFSVIAFNDNANHVGNAFVDDSALLLRANSDNKNAMLEKIDALQAAGGTNFITGFDLAFKTFKSSDAAELSSSCHKAILFLTDGENNDDTGALMSFIDQQRSVYEAEKKPVLFTYSFGAGATNDVPKNIACANDGIWAPVDDGGDLARSMGAYYKYFAYGLSGPQEQDFVAWVEPYEFATTGELGTTSSVPVYDRSVDPPIFAGVVGVDFPFSAMERALGKEGEEGRAEILQGIVDRSVANCPALSLTFCQLQSLREYGSGDQSNPSFKCPADSSTTDCQTSALKPKLCTDDPSLSYPAEIWNNDLNDGRTYEEKVCCTVGEEPRIANTLGDDEIKELVCKKEGGGPSAEKEKGLSVGAIVGIAVGCTLFALGLGYISKKRKKNEVPVARPTHEKIPDPLIATPVHQNYDDAVPFMVLLDLIGTCIIEFLD